MFKPPVCPGTLPALAFGFLQPFVQEEALAGRVCVARYGTVSRNTALPKKAELSTRFPKKKLGQFWKLIFVAEINWASRRRPP